MESGEICIYCRLWWLKAKLLIFQNQLCRRCRLLHLMEACLSPNSWLLYTDKLDWSDVDSKHCPIIQQYYFLFGRMQTSSCTRPIHVHVAGEGCGSGGKQSVLLPASISGNKHAKYLWQLLPRMDSLFLLNTTSANIFNGT